MAPFFDALTQDGIYIVRLLIAVILGGLVGTERQIRGRAAGLRTNILVCLGSAAIIVTFQKFSFEFNIGAESVIRMDPARVAAGVITGIGFLGAGTIIKCKNFVRGLTTAASIWVVSAIGVTIGLGEYIIAVIVTLLVLLALYALHRIPIAGDHYYSLHLKWTGDLGLLDEVTGQLLQYRLQIKNRSVVCLPKTGNCQATLVLRMREKETDIAIINQLQSDERFDEISWK